MWRPSGMRGLNVLRRTIVPYLRRPGPLSGGVSTLQFAATPKTADGLYVPPNYKYLLPPLPRAQLQNMDILLTLTTVGLRIASRSSTRASPSRSSLAMAIGNQGRLKPIDAACLTNGHLKMENGVETSRLRKKVSRFSAGFETRILASMLIS